MEISSSAIKSMQITLERCTHNDESNLQCDCDCVATDDNKSIFHCLLSLFDSLQCFSVRGKPLLSLPSDSALLKMQTWRAITALSVSVALSCAWVHKYCLHQTQWQSADTSCSATIGIVHLRALMILVCFFCFVFYFFGSHQHIRMNVWMCWLSFPPSGIFFKGFFFSAELTKTKCCNQ